MVSHTYWLAILDGRHCCLHKATVTRRGGCRITSVGEIDNHQPPVEHGRPSMLDSRLGHHTAAPNHEAEEHTRRFAAEAADWLCAQVKENHADRLAVCCESRMLGYLRKASPTCLKTIVDEYDVDLVAIRASQLAEHPLVRRIVGLDHS